MIPQDTRDTLRIGFKSGSVIEVKVEGAQALIEGAVPPFGCKPTALRTMIGDAFVDFAEVEFMQVVPKQYPQMDPASFSHGIPGTHPDFSRNRQAS